MGLRYFKRSRITDLKSPNRLEAQAKVAISASNISVSTPETVNGVQFARTHDQSEVMSSMAQAIPAGSGFARGENEGVEEIIRDAMPQEESAFDLAGGFGEEVSDFDAQLLEDICKTICSPTFA